MGHLIPAGTGFYQHRDVDIAFTVEEPEPKQAEPGEDEEYLDGEETSVAVEELPLQANAVTVGEESA